MVSAKQSLLPNYNTLQLLDSCSVYLLVEVKFYRECKNNNRRIMHSEQTL